MKDAQLRTEKGSKATNNKSQKFTVKILCIVVLQKVKLYFLFFCILSFTSLDKAWCTTHGSEGKG
jgi:hypothetical protein